MYGDKVRETSTFIKHMNKWFDCLNTRHLYIGQETNNDDAYAFTDPNDPRLDYLSETFLGYFDEWNASVQSRPGNFSKEDRAKMMLSQQTLNGLKISVRSIVACTRFLLNQGAKYVLTNRFNQDVLEQHFGHKQGSGDNPCINDIRHTINTLRSVQQTAMAPLRGNTKRLNDEDTMQSLINEPLARKKSRSAKL